MRKIFTLLLLLCSLTLTAQQYNNEWINFNQTYYKFKVATAGVYRVSKTVLDAAGIGNTPVENLELWRNGQPVPFYPSVPAGALPVGGYIEFWGVPNDGKPDKPMYREAAYQHSDKISLQTDTAVYFLSINTSQTGYRINEVANNVAANLLPVEPFFMYTHGVYFRNRRNAGFAAVVGEYVFSSSFDKGEYWSSAEIRPATPLNTNVGNLYAEATGPAVSTLRFGVSGNALNPRRVKVKVNGNEVIDTLMDYFNDINASVNFNTSLITGAANAVELVNTSAISSDRMVSSYLELTYPRKFNFDNKKTFAFNLPAKNDGYFLNISNFNHGGVAPVLYDLNSRERYVGDISTPGMVKFALPGSTLERKLVLVNEQASNITEIASLTTRVFRRFSDVSNQGDFLIITHPILYTGTAGNNPVIDYKNYRQSSAGGGHKVLIAEIDELVDQFGFGIKKHPLSVRNFIRYARTNFAEPVNFVFLMGRGMNYVEYNANQANAVVEQLNLVPTFGLPASDNLLSSANVTSPVPVTPIGRLSVVSGKEIEDYLEKVIQYENAQATSPNTISGKKWMKNVVHVTGSSDPYLGTVLCNYMGALENIIEDTVFGGTVSTFCKTSTNPVEQLSSERLTGLFNEGISFLTYFGHSSSTTLEFNIDNPQAYDNEGKYPVFFVNGCNAGNFFTFYPQRLVANETLSEKFTLAKKRGSIAFVASTHFGIVNYLNLFLNNLYSVIGQQDYGRTLGEVNRDAMQQMLNATGQYDFYARLHAEEITLHGDPAIVINSQPKPDYLVEESLIQVSPNFISIAENNYGLKVKMLNLGRTTSDSIRVEIKQQYPDGTTGIVFNQKIKAIPYADSLQLQVPIIATRDKGLNKLTITVDADFAVDEITEMNNVTTKEFYVIEDEARPSYPYEFSIITDPNQKLYASTANPFSNQKTYLLEIDTTENFNSASKVSKSVVSNGGAIEFDPGITYTDSTIYYWRVALAEGDVNNYHWVVSSFRYINGPNEGFGQAHYFQHLKSATEKIHLTDSLKWVFGHSTHSLFIRNAVYPTGSDQAQSYIATLDNTLTLTTGCYYNELIINVVDPVTFKPWVNKFTGSAGLYNSYTCAANKIYNFMYSYATAADRKKAMDFLDLIPDGKIVMIRGNTSPGPPSYTANVFVDQWKADTALYGPGNSLYHKLFYAGFYELDSFYVARTFSFAYKKGDSSFVPKYIYSNGINDRINLAAVVQTMDTVGVIKSPKFGPARYWHDLKWDGHSIESPSNDNPTVQVIGIDNNNFETLLYVLDKNTKTFDLSSVDAGQYPYLQLRMRNMDSVTLSPFQLDNWQIHYDPVPEGALAANLYLVSRDSMELGEIFKFGIAFKNISKVDFDSVTVKVTVLDRNNITHVLSLPKQKPILKGDTAIIQFEIDTKDYAGLNTLFVNVNPDFDQPEHYLFNNFLYKDFYVRQDRTNPVLDVTFDGVHILNRDIVSAKPHIQINLKDESKFLLLNDTALSTIQLKYPDGSLRTFNYDNDTLQFIPASDNDDNTAIINFKPVFSNQADPMGDEYELIIKGKDRSGNKAGDLDYRVAFKVISKPMISNLLNYPNPFSTSTAFVFTITGSELPQNMKIQILTVTGKIVREITMNELGPIHIGRNITEFKWDGTDQFGQKLANGVYLYRVVTTLNGSQMEKYRAEGDNTDKFFNNGYGKMYLMR